MQTNINNEAATRTSADGGLDTRLTAVEKGSVSPQTDLNMNKHNILNVGPDGINVSTHRHGLNAGAATPPDPVLVSCKERYDPNKDCPGQLAFDKQQRGGAYYITFSKHASSDGTRVYKYSFSIKASSGASIPICAVTTLEFSSGSGGWDDDDALNIHSTGWNASTSSWNFEMVMSADWGTDKPIYGFMAAVIDNIGGPSNP